MGTFFRAALVGLKLLLYSVKVTRYLLKKADDQVLPLMMLNVTLSPINGSSQPPPQPSRQSSLPYRPLSSPPRRWSLKRSSLSRRLLGVFGGARMPRLLHQVTIPEQAIAADGIQAFELGVNPLSVLLVTLRPLNDTGVLANYQRYRAICAALNRLTISWNGQSIISMRGEDLAALNWLRWGMVPWEANPDNVDNERRAVVLPVVLGRSPYDVQSCFPATKRGELILECDFDIADTGYDGLRFSAESIELLDAKPKEYERRVMRTTTWAATGTNDLDLLAGLPCRGVLLFGTTGFAGATPAPSWGRIKLMLDNQEVSYHATDWEVAMMLPTLWGRQLSMVEHKHTVNAAGAGVEETTSVFDADEDWTLYSYLDLDPTKDDTFTLDTSKGTAFVVRAEAETADAVRAYQMEVVKT